MISRSYQNCINISQAAEESLFLTEEAQLSNINEVLSVSFLKLMNLNFKILLVSVTGFFGRILQTEMSFNSDPFTSHLQNPLPTSILILSSSASSQYFK
jgi:hypothetical protein